MCTANCQVLISYSSLDLFLLEDMSAVILMAIN